MKYVDVHYIIEGIVRVATDDVSYAERDVEEWDYENYLPDTIIRSEFRGTLVDNKTLKQEAQRGCKNYKYKYNK